MKRVLTLLTILGATLLLWGGGSGSQLTIITPNKQTVWKEGKRYTISWQTSYSGSLCIEIALGGHPKGVVNDCKTPAAQERYKVYIPKGFISDFGISKERNAKVAIYPKGKWESAVMSESFTIIAPK